MVKVLIQLCKGFNNEQTAITVTLNFVAMATSKVVKVTLILPFEGNNKKLHGESFCF